MSAVNPASVVNPAGMAQVPPPSAIGPGAILPSNTNTPLPVGPGFGSNMNRHGQHYNHRNHGAYNNYDEGFHAFSHQLPGYPPQPQFNMRPWGPAQQMAAHGQQMGHPLYQNFYPNVTASGSPMNYPGAGYYTPTTYPSTYGGGYGPTTTTAGYAASRNYTSNAGPSFGQVPASYGGNVPYTSGPTQSNAGGYYGSSAGQANGTSGAQSGGGAYTATTAPHHNSAFNPALMAAMQQMSIGN